MVNEMRGGGLVVPLGPELQACPRELLRQRRGQDGQPRYLVRWSLVRSESSAGPDAGSVALWMSAEEACASCPALLGEGKPAGLRAEEEEEEEEEEEKEEEEEERAGGPDEASLREMEADVGSLVRRAGRQLGGTGAASVLDTVHVLSAYAGIGSLAGAFRETGALDLLARMLCHKDKRICRSAGKMLRALASHDAGSRSYILLSLSQQDGVEQHMDFDSRYTLLELFAETTSSEEHCMSFEGIHLPQIPGKQLFALVKRYLRVTSLLEEQGGEQPESSRLKQEFEFSMAMAGLIVELLRAMGWEHSHEPEPTARQETKPQTPRSIFQPKTPACFAAPAPVLSPNRGAQKKQGAAFLTLSDFTDRKSYVEYVQANLVPGMRVRLLEDCGEVRAGDEGEFLHSTDRMHTAQVLWQSTGRTYWMHWHMLEIIGFGDQWDDPDGQEKEYSLIESFNLDKGAQPFCPKPLGGLYSPPYLGEQPSQAAGTLSRAEWWELLFFVRQLEAQEQEEIARLLQRQRAAQLPGLDEEALIQLPVPAGLAQEVLRVLEERSRGGARSHLRGSRVYGKYWPGRGAERDGGGSPEVPSEGAGCGSAGPGATRDEAARDKEAKDEAARDEDDVCEEPKSDSQLFGELLEREGLRFPEAAESGAWGSCEGAHGRGSLAEVARVAEAIRSGGCEAELRVAGLQHMVRVLQQEPEPEPEQQQPGGEGSREKLVRAAVELLSAQAAEKRPAALALRLVALLLERRAWRVPFATEGGVWAVLGCMRQHAASALVQQAGLAALKALVGAGEPGGAAGTPSALSHGDAQLLREVFASIGSAGGEGSPGLLSAIPAAVRAMRGVPGGASGVRNGLLVLRMLVDGHRGLAEQLVSGELPAVLQSCWRDGQGPTALLALGVINRLAEHRLPLGPETPGAEALLEARDAQTPAGGPGDDALPEDVVVALERQLCGGGPDPEPSSRASPRPQERRCFRALLRSLELQGAEKSIGLRILRILNKFLDGFQEDALPWYECVEPCLSLLSAHSSDREAVQEVVGFLHRLAAASKDCAVAMCRAGTYEALAKALEKHSSAVPTAPALLQLLSGCEKVAGLHRTLTGSILAGCIQLALGQIEEHRRSQRPISIPFFDVFLRKLCRGSSVEAKEDKCWEKVQVSSNPHRAGKLTDGNPKTYWESNGSTGSHFITLHMQCGVVVRELSMLVASEDSSYMPARVVVLGGDSPAAIRTELNAVTVPPSASRVVLLRNAPRFWPLIQIRVKRCQQGGIDTRVRGIEVLGPKPSFWPVFKEQLCRRTSLCCAARAHAWGQEIRRDRGRLLQLFGRLNRALRHEQDFAERFLPDDEAARALGRTCWEALVSPLVQSITSPDPSGVSPLAWLLSEYLGSGEPAPRPPARGDTFGSCVRLLTQLLVHVDPGGAEPEEARAAGGQEGRNKEALPRAVAQTLSGLRGMAQCWSSVVQQQVQRFLQAAGQAPDVAERYCGLYQRLRGATEELFGQQAAFLGALGQGFAGALLQLPFLTALHASERFARYLDGKIQELGGAAGSTGLLQQLLEPFVVFSGLEFAHTFEHFYRLYLGDRLLAQGPSWLEGAVLEQLGLCFPRRFPQQMLSDLAESEELQRQFRLFQLQERDKRLLEPGAESPEHEAPGEAPEVTVLALSPRCWPVSPLCRMAEPGRFFPAALSSPLGAFAAFCGQSQSWAGARPRGLQWTWLGRAELRFGDCVLHVSTLQMFVLLRFNGAEEVAVESLLQATGLPVELLQQALAPLTEGEAVLLRSCAPGGALRLNRAALAQASGRQLRLLPRQRYLRAERAESGALERKRNVLCCLLSRILKAEKRLHIDNLVFRVLAACQKGELGPGLQFPSFCCHSVDVLSCVLHLLNQGYLRRQEERPHVLEYVPDEPTTPPGGQAQMVFQRQLPATSPDEDSQDCPYRSNSGTDRAEEFLLAMLPVPMGHTLSLEEAKLLMNQTVQRVQDTLSIPEDVARHLLMHCRWNVDFLIHCYVEDRRSLLIASGLEVEDAQRPPSPGTHCPVCVNQLCPTEKPPSLCCMHYCCKPCWNEYLTTRIEQNMVLSCTCPISECRAQPTTAFIYSIVSSKEIIAKYEKALLRGYVECCSNLTWCTNPQGCDQILLKDGLGYEAACSKCSWISCFNCNFPEAHYPASCSHMSQWVDDDGYYEGMTSEAQSKHLAKLISKHCPSCQAQIEKNEGCLHMTCAKCNHGFCWRCLKPWRPTHKDYYNCSAMVSKAAWQEKRFQDYNERCTFHHRAREFATSLRNRVSSVSEMPKIRTLTFVLHACKVLEQARKVLAYSCVYSYYNQDTESVDIVEQQTESLELHTNALQILLEESLLQYQDLSSSLQLLKAEHFNTGLELVHRIKERLFAILWHSTQDFRVGLETSTDPSENKEKLSNVPSSAPACIGPRPTIFCESPNTDEDGKENEDEEYDPQWQEDYDDDDDDDLDEDNFQFDDESDNLDCDSYFDDDDAYD
ncbi:cullin-9 isoform X2 [Anas platyrhynchos]|uniref:cullin-9 isoform X2 n=1 Tax=Anas platyrhynchos TaxID=8839 RepID=UPI003AF24FC3